jgi:hypothetical protein
MRRYELIQMVDIEWHVFLCTKGVQPFYGKGPLPLLWPGSRVARGKITSGVRHCEIIVDYARGLKTHAVNETR